MKKFIAFMLCMVIVLMCVIPVSAATLNPNYRSINFYIQRFGVQMDSEGQVAPRSTSQFTGCVGYGELAPILVDGEEVGRDSQYHVVYKDGVVSSDDVIAEAISTPSTASILAAIKTSYEGRGYILTRDKKVVQWDKFTTDNYDVIWYVLKWEPSDKAWHVDGLVIDKETKDPIDIPAEGDPEYVPPETYEPAEDPQPKPLNFKSRYAYIYGYNDTEMAAEAPLLRSEVSAMIHRLVKQNNRLGGFVYNEANTPVFADTAGEWSRVGIEYMNSKGAFAPAENVYPYVAISRGEAFKLVCLGLGFSSDANLSYDAYGKLLLNAGYIIGDGNGDLNLDASITRAEFCTIYNRIIDRDEAGLETADGAVVTAATYGFEDLNPGAWYYETMLKATSSYDSNGYVDLELRNERNVLDEYR